MSKTHCEKCHLPLGDERLYHFGNRHIHAACWNAYVLERQRNETPEQRGRRLARMKEYSRRYYAAKREKIV